MKLLNTRISLKLLNTRISLKLLNSRISLKLINTRVALKLLTTRISLKVLNTRIALKLLNIRIALKLLSIRIALKLLNTICRFRFIPRLSSNPWVGRHTHTHTHTAIKPTSLALTLDRMFIDGLMIDEDGDINGDCRQASLPYGISNTRSSLACPRKVVQQDKFCNSTRPNPL